MLDLVATVYAVWWLAEGPDASGTTRAAAAKDWRPAMVAGLLIAVSLARGIYTLRVQFPDRPLFAVDVRDPDWRDAMAFARTTDPGSGWLADPLHAARYGSSLRAAGHRDVLVERLKDPAIAMYDRDIAMRLADRERALAALAWNTPDGARALARRYGLDYLVVDRELDLPQVHRSGSLRIYTLR